MKESDQGMEVIEKTRLKREKTVEVEWEERWREEWMKWRKHEDKQVWKNQKRHQTKESIHLCCKERDKKVRVKMDEWESWKRFEVFEIWKRFLGGKCESITIHIRNRRWKMTEDSEMEWERNQIIKTFKNTWRKRRKTVITKTNKKVIWSFMRMGKE